MWAHWICFSISFPITVLPFSSFASLFSLILNGMICSPYCFTVLNFRLYFSFISWVLHLKINFLTCIINTSSPNT